MKSASEKLRSILSESGPVPFARFMEFALYDPGFGYYKAARQRVGRNPRTDFFTATSLGSVFAELVIAATEELLKPDAPSSFSFLEIGAEPDSALLPDNHPFQSATAIRHGETPVFPRKTIFFSNELFDAQPFHRLVFHNGNWREIGVTLENGKPTETLLPDLSQPVRDISHRLPESSAEGYHLDLPVAAEKLLENFVTASNWSGLLILFDYGKSWREMIEATPQGTARAYRQHRQSNDLLADPGKQDLTCHICWDWLISVLGKNGFHEIKLQSQEAFFITTATKTIEKIITEKPGEFDPRRQTIQQLIHPGQMGQKFQVLTAKR